MVLGGAHPQYVRSILQQQSSSGSSTSTSVGGTGIGVDSPYSDQLCAVLVDMLCPQPERRPGAADLLVRCPKTVS